MLLEVKVQPRSNRNTVEVIDQGKLRVRVRVTAAAEGGKANQAVVALLAKKLGVPRSSITIVRGATSRSKVLEVRGLDHRVVSANMRLQ